MTRSRGRCWKGWREKQKHGTCWSWILPLLDPGMAWHGILCASSPGKEDDARMHEPRPAPGNSVPCVALACMHACVRHASLNSWLDTTGTGTGTGALYICVTTNVRKFLYVFLLFPDETWARALCQETSVRPCLVHPENPSHRILWHMHKTLNINKNKN